MSSTRPIKQSAPPKTRMPWLFLL